METDREVEFVRLISACDGEIRRYLYTLLPNMADVDEVMQETAQALWLRFDEYDPNRPFKRWAYRFAYFEALRFRKRVSRDRLVFREELLDIIAAEREEEEPLLKERRAALEFCLKKVADPDRDLLRQRYEGDEKMVKLAQKLGQPVKQLYNKLNRLRASLALCIEKQLAYQGLDEH